MGNIAHENFNTKVLVLGIVLVLDRLYWNNLYVSCNRGYIQYVVYCLAPVPHPSHIPVLLPLLRLLIQDLEGAAERPRRLPLTAALLVHELKVVQEVELLSNSINEALNRGMQR